MLNLFVYKRNEETGNSTDMTRGNLSYDRMFSNRKKGSTTRCLKSICFRLQKILFVIKSS